MELRADIIKVLESIEGYRGLEHEQQADAILTMLWEKHAFSGILVLPHSHEPPKTPENANDCHS
jgi:hypothetical protein